MSADYEAAKVSSLAPAVRRVRGFAWRGWAYQMYWRRSPWRRLAALEQENERLREAIQRAQSLDWSELVERLEASDILAEALGGGDG